MPVEYIISTKAKSLISLGADASLSEPYLQIKNDGEINLFTESNNIIIQTDQKVEVK